jgi:hypothetical protein
MTRAVTLVVALAAAALLGAADGAATQAQSTTLTASVGPGLTISLRTAGGAAVTRLNPGTYTINVNDQSDFHSFALSGPGVSEDSGVAFIGMVSWTVTLTNGTYVFRCSAHPTSMRGTFTGGSGGAPAVKTITPATRLVVTSGPAQVITLKTAGGAAVKQMKVGNYNVTTAGGPTTSTSEARASTRGRRRSRTPARRSGRSRSSAPGRSASSATRMPRSA